MNRFRVKLGPAYLGRECGLRSNDLVRSHNRIVTKSTQVIIDSAWIPVENLFRLESPVIDEFHIRSIWYIIAVGIIDVTKMAQKNGRQTNRIRC